MYWKAMYVQTGTANGIKFSFLRSIITVQADTMSEALVKVEEELTKNPDQSKYYDRWVADGRFVVISREGYLVEG